LRPICSHALSVLSVAKIIDTFTDCRNSSALKGGTLNWNRIVARFLSFAQSCFAGIFQVYEWQRFSQQLHAISQLDVAITNSGIIPHFYSAPSPQIPNLGSPVTITEAPSVCVVLKKIQCKDAFIL
jgi:hypothetical protein